MKTNLLKSLILVSVSIAFTAFKSLKLDKNTYTITPNPLELHGDSIKINMEGRIPEKTFHPKAVITFTPIVKTASGDKELTPVTYIGQKVKDTKGVAIQYKTGGKISYSGSVGYAPDLKVAQLDVRVDAKLKSKSKNFRTKVADATIVTPLLLQTDDKAIAAKDQMPGVIPMSASADILFVVNQSEVRSTELSQDDVKSLWTFIDEAESDIMDGKKVVGKKVNYDIKGVSISAYASPDGIESKNATLASDRANSSAKALIASFKKYKMDAGTKDAFYNKTSTPEDWEGFKQLMSQSNISDKDMILRILSTNSDIEAREQEMKNISKAYTEISDQIFPKLRRAKITINAERKPRTDEMISKMAVSAPDSLNLEELMRAGSLSNDMNNKSAIYSKVINKFPKK